MRKLLNTLYVMTEDAYLSAEGQTVAIQNDEGIIARIPLHGLESIISFSYRGASPAIIGICAAQGIDLCFMRPNGQFLARVCGRTRGNVLLKKTQFRISEDSNASLSIARNMIIGKIYNSRWILERATRDHSLSVNIEMLKQASSRLKESINRVQKVESLDVLRGIEGEAASEYFGVFNELILQGGELFTFHGRSKKPSLDRVNAMLSFGYSLLAENCASALEGVGLDPYVGFLHTDRPGRYSLALDLIEELRAVMVDRFVLTCINNRIVNVKMFDQYENGSVMLNDKGRKTFLSAWQDRKKETMTHPFLGEKIPWGLIPHLQALLLSRYMRGDLDEYPPLLWK